MSRPAVRVKGLSKQYRLGAGGGSQRMLREVLSDTVSRWVRLGQHRSENATASFWALRDVEFDIQQGEIVGFIGRNGAGKSTLLKVLSEITEPTSGRVEISGRVASLLEVGTGFHDELTGRENVLLNGAILGMSRGEILRKFDEIVAFAEVEQFIDTPVKRYSSGMYLRLAFAVAAHLEPEILIVDEVLAVGDANFQKKCIAKMEDVGQEGRTVLFVSHNMQAVTRLCGRTILLDGGAVLDDGPSHKVVSTYLKIGTGSMAEREWRENDNAPGNDRVRLRAVRVRDRQGYVSEAIDIRHPVTLEMEFDVLHPGMALVPNLHFFDQDGTNLFVLHDADPQWRRRPRDVGRYRSTVEVPGNFFAEGTISVRAVVATHTPVEIHAECEDAVAFQVIDCMDGTTARGDYAGPMPGAVRPMFPWKNETLGAAPQVLAAGGKVGR